MDRFKNVPNKSKRRFIKFDIADFYPSIAKDLSEVSVEYAKSFTTIESKALEAIQLARKSLLFSKDRSWVKKDSSLLDVTMGSFMGSLSDLSCNEEEFKKAKPIHENALKEGGYKLEMKYEKSERLNNRSRQCNITWFNPPYSQNVKINIGKVFL